MDVDFGRMRADRLRRLGEELDRSGADGLVLLGTANQEYAGIRRPCSDAMRVHYEPAVVALTTAGERHVWTPYPDGVPPEVRSERVHRELDVEFEAGAVAFVRALHEVFGAGARLAIDELPGAVLEADADFEWLDGSAITAAARLCKTPDEIACLRRAQHINEVAIESVRAALRPGVRQTELSAILFRRAFELGATASCVDPIWNLMPRSRWDQSPTVGNVVAFPRAATDRFLREGDLVFCDTGLVWEGYHSDFGATWICADDPRPSPRLRDCHRRWRDLMATVYEAVRPGRSCGDVVREVVRREPHYKLDHFYLAHGIGCDAAEPPFVGTDRPLELDDAIELREGMALVFEPVVWEDGIGGYRGEEMVVVTEGGCERISRHGYAPFED